MAIFLFNMTSFGQVPRQRVLCISQTHTHKQKIYTYFPTSRNVFIQVMCQRKAEWSLAKLIVTWPLDKLLLLAKTILQTGQDEFRQSDKSKHLCYELNT